MKTTIRILLIIILFIIFSMLCKLTIDIFFVNTIYTVSGIMFSVGLGLIVTFSISGVRNKEHIRQLRTNINKVRNSFLKYFLLTTICYTLNYYLRQMNLIITEVKIKEITIILNWSILFVLLMLYAIVYYIVNFTKIQNLHNDIFDKINGFN